MDGDLVGGWYCMWFGLVVDCWMKRWCVAVVGLVVWFVWVNVLGGLGWIVVVRDVDLLCVVDFLGRRCCWYGWDV